MTSRIAQYVFPVLRSAEIPYTVRWAQTQRTNTPAAIQFADEDTLYCPVGTNTKEHTLKVPGSQFSVPDSQFSIPGSRFSVLGSQFSVLSSWFSVPGSRFSVLGSRFLVLGSRFLVLGSWFLVPGSWFSIRDARTPRDTLRRSPAGASTCSARAYGL